MHKIKVAHYPKPRSTKERKSNSLQARNSALSASQSCLQAICENRRLEVRALLRHLRACTGDEAESTAHQCDHFHINASEWWKAVKRARKFLKQNLEETDRTANTLLEAREALERIFKYVSKQGETNLGADCVRIRHALSLGKPGDRNAG